MQKMYCFLCKKDRDKPEPYALPMVVVNDAKNKFTKEVARMYNIPQTGEEPYTVICVHCLGELQKKEKHLESLLKETTFDGKLQNKAAKYKEDRMIKLF